MKPESVQEYDTGVVLLERRVRPGASAEQRKRRTLTNLYDQRPTWLDLAHRTLDHAVLAPYGWPHDLSDEEVLSRLLALNLERAGGLHANIPVKVPA